MFDITEVKDILVSMGKKFSYLTIALFVLGLLVVGAMTGCNNLIDVYDNDSNKTVVVEQVKELPKCIIDIDINTTMDKWVIPELNSTTDILEKHKEHLLATNFVEDTRIIISDEGVIEEDSIIINTEHELMIIEEDCDCMSDVAVDEYNGEEDVVVDNNENVSSIDDIDDIWGDYESLL